MSQQNGIVLRLVKVDEVHLQRSGTAWNEKNSLTFVGRTQHRRGYETLDIELGLVPAACERKKFVSRAPHRRG